MVFDNMVIYPEANGATFSTDYGILFWNGAELRFTDYRVRVRTAELEQYRDWAEPNRYTFAGYEAVLSDSDSESVLTLYAMPKRKLLCRVVVVKGWLDDELKRVRVEGDWVYLTQFAEYLSTLCIPCEEDKGMDTSHLSEEEEGDRDLYLLTGRLPF